MTWTVLAEWGSVQILERFEDGIANDVRLVELDGRRVVARLGDRSHANLRWEQELLAHLASSGMIVPTLVPARDGRFHIDGLMVMEYIDGHIPRDRQDWIAVGEYLAELHELTRDWPQRPGFLSSRDLIAQSVPMTIADITKMPEEVVSCCRQAWQRIASSPLSVVHGDPNSTNVRITTNGVALLDWDESRVDVSLLDFGGLPVGLGVLDDVEREWQAQQAFSAWDAAVCWELAPKHAQERVAGLLASIPGA